MVTSQDNKDLFIIGGGLDDSNFKWTCEKLTPDSCVFQEIQTKLQIARGRHFHVALPISNEFAEKLCQ